MSNFKNALSATITPSARTKVARLFTVTSTTLIGAVLWFNTAAPIIYFR